MELLSSETLKDIFFHVGLQAALKIFTAAQIFIPPVEQITMCNVKTIAPVMNL